MAKIHRSDAPLPQTPSVQVKASYTVTDLPKVSPQELRPSTTRTTTRTIAGARPRSAKKSAVICCTRSR